MTTQLTTAARAAGLAAATMALLPIALVAASGCDGRGVADYAKRVPTPGTAALPDKPDLNPKQSPAQYEDGAWSVRGVLESGTAGRKGNVALVRGFVAKVRTCAAGAKVCKPAPHLLLTDRETLQGRRLLVGGDLPAEAGEGKRITVSGTMMTSSDDGLYFAPGGLLLIQAPKDAPAAAGGDTAAVGAAARAPAKAKQPGKTAPKAAD